MRRLLTGHAVDFNRRYRRHGQLFQNGRKPDLVGGGLTRSTGGWSTVKALRKGVDRMKGDERILGEGDFVETDNI